MQRAQRRGRHTTTLFLHLRKYAQSVLFRRLATPGETPSANYLLPYNSEKAAKLAHARCNFVCGGAREKQQHPSPCSPPLVQHRITECDGSYCQNRIGLAAPPLGGVQLARRQDLPGNLVLQRDFRLQQALNGRLKRRKGLSTDNAYPVQLVLGALSQRVFRKERSCFVPSYGTAFSDRTQRRLCRFRLDLPLARTRSLSERPRSSERPQQEGLSSAW